MGCGGCGRARWYGGQAIRAVRHNNLQAASHNARQMIKTAINVNVEKLRGTYDDSKYSNDQPVKAKPYQRST